MHVYYTRIILLCLLVEDVDIVVYLSLLLIYNIQLYCAMNIASVNMIILCCVIIIIEKWIYSIIGSSNERPLRDCETITSSWC